MAAPVDRSEVRRAYRPDEETVVLERIAEARLEPAALGEATASAGGAESGVNPYAGMDISRNAPCPCGSGQKYKFCHGA